MGRSPGGQEIKEGGCSAGGKKDFMVYEGLTKAQRARESPGV